jgi:hypothetical protein
MLMACEAGSAPLYLAALMLSMPLCAVSQVLNTNNPYAATLQNNAILQSRLTNQMISLGGKPSSGSGSRVCLIDTGFLATDRQLSSSPIDQSSISDKPPDSQPPSDAITVNRLIDCPEPYLAADALRRAPQRHAIRQQRLTSTGVYRSLTHTPTESSAPAGPTKAPVTGDTASGNRATATAMCRLPAISPLVGSKPFQPAPGR